MKACEAGTETVFTMQLWRSQFLVKNFTAGNITVKLGNNDTASTIAPGSWEIVFNNAEDNITPEAVREVKVTAVEAGNVEVASIDY